MRRLPLLLLLAVLAAVLTAPPATAAGRIDVGNANGDPVADPTYATTLTLRASGFQSVEGGFGGVYVMFGWVRGGGAWKPSQGGASGTDYKYVPDSQSKKNAGFQRYVAFPGSDTAGSANGGTMTADGRFTVELVVPGAVFDTAGGTVDCRKVTCGIITIGAHGVVNARNETFTPVRFASLQGQTPGDDAGGSGDTTEEDTGTTEQGTPGTDGITDDPEAAGGEAGGRGGGKGTGALRVTVDRATAVEGRVLTFTARGLQPGEQVVASLDDGVAAVGPLTASAAGDLAGVLPLPADVGVGTHTLQVTGATSGRTAELGFPVAAGDAEVATAADTRSTPTTTTTEEWSVGAVVFLAVSAGVLGLAVGLTVARGVFPVIRRRRAVAS
ncbi:hypothetical protein [Nocardioides caldifontis]|uniref:hypothetical protein n=1 Tax=Nocardioides caldifontis TaxID=2588938 RepID=UPI0011E01AFC|nr:hypothetical protein [Nocardioides caldifontis]